MFTRLLSLLDGGQKQPLSKLLKSDLKTIAILFLTAFGVSAAIATFAPEPQTDLDVTKPHFVDF